MRKVTLVLIREHNRLLLGLKKRGFGKGKYNGFGGKCKATESLFDCAIRETKEESGLIASELRKVAKLDFRFLDKPDWNQQVHVYESTAYTGSLVETDEMKPEWFEIDTIPYNSMWEADCYWLPKVLDNNLVRGKSVF